MFYWYACSFVGPGNLLAGRKGRTIGRDKGAGKREGGDPPFFLLLPSSLHPNLPFA